MTPALALPALLPAPGELAGYPATGGAPLRLGLPRLQAERLASVLAELVPPAGLRVEREVTLASLPLALASLREAWPALPGEVLELAALMGEWADGYAGVLGLATRGLGLKLAHETGQPCPKFHLDSLPFRLIVTLQGPGTQWLAADETPRELAAGQVAVLPGKNGPGRGTLHRSPPAEAGRSRLVLTVDPLCT